METETEMKTEVVALLSCACFCKTLLSPFFLTQQQLIQCNCERRRGLTVAFLLSQASERPDPAEQSSI